MLFRWFVGLTTDEKVFDASTFSKNRDRLLTHKIAQQPGDEVPVFQFRVGSAATMTIAASSPSTAAIRAKASAASD